MSIFNFNLFFFISLVLQHPHFIVADSSSESSSSESSESSDGQRPHIVVLLLDDLGWNDIGYTGGNLVRSPTIDALAEDGLKLNKFYVFYNCSPTRGAFLTGRYPSEIGLQSGAIRPESPYGLPLEYTLLSQVLQDNGYTTYNIGKWHLGYFEESYWPTQRGFDFFYGGLIASSDRFTFERCLTFCGIDFRDNTEPVGANNTEFMTYLFGNYTIDILDNYDEDEDDPLFLYFGFQMPHTPIQAPPEWIEYANDTSTYVGDEARVVLNAMVSITDFVIGKIVDKLVEKNMWDNTIILFASDNGGLQNRRAFGSNYPLRGRKQTPWEGGVRVPAFFNGGLLNDNLRGEEYNNLIYISDLYKTLLRYAEIDNYDDSQITGLDLYDSLQNPQVTYDNNPDNLEIREEVLIFLRNDTRDCESFIGDKLVCGALIYRNYKYLIGIESNDNGNKARFFPVPTTTTIDYNYSVACNTSQQPVLGSNSDIRDICGYSGTSNGCLYDLNVDPCEYNNLGDLPEYASIKADMEARLLTYFDTLSPDLSILNPDNFPNIANPANYGGWWSVWDFNILENRTTTTGNPFTSTSESPDSDSDDSETGAQISVSHD